MAELGSILPIAGAQYHWTHILAPESTRKFITWMQGIAQLPQVCGKLLSRFRMGHLVRLGIRPCW